MCQQQIIKYLEKRKGKEVDINELIRVIPVSRANISRACSQMAKYREIKIRQVKQGSFTRFMFSV
jgi:predicted transcriptional regulator